MQGRHKQYFFSAEDQTQGVEKARQVLYLQATPQEFFFNKNLIVCQDGLRILDQIILLPLLPQHLGLQAQGTAPRRSKIFDSRFQEHDGKVLFTFMQDEEHLVLKNFPKTLHKKGKSHNTKTLTADFCERCHLSSYWARVRISTVMQELISKSLIQGTNWSQLNVKLTCNQGSNKLPRSVCKENQRPLLAAVKLNYQGSN